MSRTSLRDTRIGLVLVASATALVGLVVVASGGPGYLVADRTAIDIYFRDGQGIRVGHPVRIAGLETGRVTSVDVVEYQGGLRARVRIALRSDLAARLNQDAIVMIESGLTGQSSVNIASVGESGVSWVPGQPIEGIEGSLFDPLLEQVGLGPAERDHLSYTISHVRETIDEISPRLQKILASFQQAADDVRGATKVAGPAVAEASGKLEGMLTKVDELLAKADSLVAELDGAVKDNREGVTETIADLRHATAQARVLLQQNGPKVGELIGNLDQTRARVDRVLYQADVSLTNLSEIIAGHRADIERSFANVRDISDFVLMTVQRIHSNPLILSPLYKPSREAEAALAKYDTAGVVMKAAGEFKDAVSDLQALRGQTADPRQQQKIDAMLQRSASIMNEQLNPLLQNLARGVQAIPDRPRGITRQGP